MQKDKQPVDVLLVEDNPDDSELTIYALKKGNATVNLLLLKDGVEALNFIFAQKTGDSDYSPSTLKLILLDLKLPRIDGLEVLRKIRENEQTRAFPVVILTSSRERRDIAEAYSLAVNSYVVKPVDFENYITTVSTLAVYWLSVNEKPF